ncbi:MAG: amidohydrolase, partial [Rhodococcus sp.]|nr:amidohydrolase [Rhodococcus sp. (in: high G+C Gram-positive bacteria)]
MTTAPKNMTDAIIRDVTLYSGGQWLTGHDVVVSNGVVESIEKSTGTATPGSVDGSGAYLIP